jgi:hypothetical protein
MKLASAKFPLLPSSMKTEYPSIEHPPLSSGSFQLILIEEVDVETFVGRLCIDGTSQAW